MTGANVRRSRRLEDRRLEDIGAQHPSGSGIPQQQPVPDAQWQRGGEPSDSQMGKAADVDPSLRGAIAPFFMASYNTRIVRRSHYLQDSAYGPDFTYAEAIRVGKNSITGPWRRPRYRRSAAFITATCADAQQPRSRQDSGEPFSPTSGGESPCHRAHHLLRLADVRCSDGGG